MDAYSSRFVDMLDLQVLQGNQQIGALWYDNFKIEIDLFGIQTQFLYHC